nr:immunoglobulin heavy chain junction region [Macaca mulatta]
CARWRTGYSEYSFGAFDFW